MEHVQIFKLSVKTYTLTYFCIIVDCGYYQVSSYGEIPKFS